ncbi:sodium-coupled monocarboxylate transporter 2-like [Amblyomma americanum]
MVRTMEYVIFGVLVAVNLLFGLCYSLTKRVSSPGVAATEAEVFLGSRALKMIPLAASAVASLYSSTGLVGFPAHFYAYGWHVIWCGITPLLFFPLATRVFVPLLYDLRVTSIFEYLRLRFNRAISLTACAIYIFLTQSVAAISIFVASLTLVTVFKASLFWSNIAIGLSGTLYTVLGGLRGVVWTDCMQFLVILIAPTTFVAKVLVDSFSSNSTVQPLGDLNIKEYIGDLSFDLTSDENVWACLWGSSALSIYRMCLDQMVVQRLLASRTLKDAQRAAVISSVLLMVMYVVSLSMGAALTIWYRGCDPGMQGAIRSIDQIVPYYLSTELIRIPGLVSMFMAGVVCAATSTVSSTINSQATILYVDVIAHGYTKADEHVLLITRCAALFLGLTMTIYSTLVVYMGSVTRIFLMVYSSITGPYVGLCLLAVLFPFVHSKGAGVATLVTMIYEMWHIAEIITSGKRPTRAPVSLDYCPGNLSATVSPVNTTLTPPGTRSDGTFFLFRLSHLWSSFFCIFATILIAVLISALTGEMSSKKSQRGLCNDALVRLWRKSVRFVLCKPEHEHVEKTPCDDKDRSLQAAECETFIMDERNSSI